jgi:LysR family hydrogen peroxide-inducible transcriptional activator
MELQQLRYVVAVARAGQFNRAAEVCHVSQPSLSQQIQKLEDELGERLFERRPHHRVRLTAAGERFVQRATAILDEVESARREVQAGRELEHGQVTVGVLPTIAPYFLPDIIGTFSRRYPGIDIVVHEDVTARLLENALAGDVDLFVAVLPLDDRRLTTRTLFQEDLLLALPAQHPLARRRVVPIEELDRERFILMREGHCLGEKVLHFCQQNDFHPHVSGRSAQIQTVLSLIRAGLGISLVPHMATRQENGDGLVFRPLQKPQPTRTIAAAWPVNRPPGPAASAFLSALSRGDLKE